MLFRVKVSTVYRLSVNKNNTHSIEGPFTGIDLKMSTYYLAWNLFRVIFVGLLVFFTFGLVFDLNFYAFVKVLYVTLLFTCCAAFCRFSSGSDERFRKSRSLFSRGGGSFLRCGDGA